MDQIINYWQLKYLIRKRTEETKAPGNIIIKCLYMKNEISKTKTTTHTTPDTEQKIYYKNYREREIRQNINKKYEIQMEGKEVVCVFVCVCGCLKLQNTKNNNNLRKNG